MIHGEATSDAPSSHRRYEPLVWVAGAAAIGISADRFVANPVGHSLATGDWVTGTGASLWWLTAVAALVLWYIAHRTARNRTATLLLFVSIGATAATWHDLRWNHYGQDEIARFATLDASPATVEAIACESPERVPPPSETPLRAIPGVERTRLVVRVVAIRDATGWRPSSGLAQLGVGGHLLGVRAGDRLRIVGQLARIRPPMNPGEFDFAAHARGDRELVRIDSSAPECVTILSSSAGWPAGGFFDRLRSHCLRLIRKYVADEAGLAGAILLGSRSDLPRDATDPYLYTGTIHVLVVSGMNVAILTTGLVIAIRLGLLPRRLGLLLVATFAIAYALLAEGQPPVVRAAVVIVLMSLAACTGRRATAFNGLGAAAIFALALNPADLFRVGPQLSFLAVATLVWISAWPVFHPNAGKDRLQQVLDSVRPWYLRTIRWGGRRIILAVSIASAVWLATVPLVLYRFNLVTPAAVVVGPLISVLVTIALYSGFGMILFGDFLTPLAALMGMICSGALSLMEAIVVRCEALPMSHFWSPGPPWWWVLVFYIALLLAMFLGRSALPMRWQCALLCLWTLVGLAAPLARAHQQHGFNCAFLSVGHGACVVLETPRGEVLLYDAGSLTAPESATRSIASYLWHRGIRRIDGIILSHADVDHYNGVPGLLERFDVGAVYVSPLMFDAFGDGAEHGGPSVLREAIDTNHVPVIEVWAGNRLRLGADVTVQVFHPPRQGVLGSDNANSLTLAIEHGGRRILLPGDLESPGIDDVMAEIPYDCDILLAPHHGSRGSDPPGFASWSTPDWVVVSGNATRDELGPVTRTYQEMGAEVLLSQESGAIEFDISEQRMHSRLRRHCIAGTRHF